ADGRRGAASTRPNAETEVGPGAAQTLPAVGGRHAATDGPRSETREDHCGAGPGAEGGRIGRAKRLTGRGEGRKSAHKTIDRARVGRPGGAGHVRASGGDHST